MPPALLNLTLKDPIRLQALFGTKLPMVHPFARATSRTRHNAEFFRFARKAESVAELLQLKSPGWNFAECCRARAREILNLKRHRYYLMFSGGIDSTAMMVAFLEVASQEELSRIRILLSAHSILENPTFFDQHVLSFPLETSMIDISDRLIRENSTVVSGECGDQLFGSDMLGDGCTAFGEEILHAPYRDASIRIISLYAKQEGQAKALFDWLDPITAECPFPIRSAHDFFWWYNFTQKWQHVKYRFLTHTTWNLRARIHEHVFPFYDTLPFQLWSLHNHHRKIKRTWESYKFPAKEYIFDFTRDPAQKALRKQQSLEKTFLMDENRIAVTDNLEVLNREEDLKPFLRT